MCGVGVEAVIIFFSQKGRMWYSSLLEIRMVYHYFIIDFEKFKLLMIKIRLKLLEFYTKMVEEMYYLFIYTESTSLD